MTRKPYPTDVKDDEWAFVLPYLTLMREDAPQREHDLREVFNALRWLVRGERGGLVRALAGRRYLACVLYLSPAVFNHHRSGPRGRMRDRGDLVWDSRCECGEKCSTCF